MAIVAGEVGTHYVKTFEANAIHLVQQKLSKFRNKVTEKNGATEKHSFRMVDARGDMVERVGELGKNASKRPATVFTDTVFNDRVCGTKVYDTADSFSKPDIKRMLENPESEIYKAMVPQVGRKFDDVLVAAFHAAALDTIGNSNAFGDAGTTPTLGGAGTLYDIGLSIQMLQAFNTDDVDVDEEKFHAVPPAVVTAILNDPKGTSADYVAAKALMSGQIVNGYLGLSWIMSNRLNHPVAGDTYLQGWTRDALGLLVLMDVSFESGKSPMNSFDTIMQLSIDIGAVRIQEKKCKRIRITE